MKAPLLLEIGCEEIPARMIRAAAKELGSRLEAILDGAGLSRGAVRAWGGSRRLAVRVEDVVEGQQNREQTVLGPPATAAFDDKGAMAPAALGFARKQGVDPSLLRVIETEKGSYVGFSRELPGRTVGEILADDLPEAVASMSFPKTMRWADGTHRWVRPVHWVLALHGDRLLDLELFGVRSGSWSLGHRFLSESPVRISHPDRYVEELRAGKVVVDPSERRRMVAESLERAATAAGGNLVCDPELLEEVVDLVEWPGVVVGHFDDGFLDLPSEILITTLRHHQKCFSVQGSAGLLPVFVAVANTDRDPCGHIRRGNEWVVGGRLQDARFFWIEDRKIPFADRGEKLLNVVFHAKTGSYGEKAERIAALAERIGRQVGLEESELAAAREGALLAKNDLTTGLVGEFPELQGIVGGLILREEGRSESIWRAVYEHYRPLGAEDAVPSTPPAAVVSVADRLDTVGRLVSAGEVPTGSRDPFGLRRALNGVFRILEQRGWPLTLADLADLAGGTAEILAFVRERCVYFLRERGYTMNEIQAVFRPQIEPTECLRWAFADILARLDAITSIRGREDFEHLVDLTKRVDNILVKGADEIRQALEAARDLDGYVEKESAAVDLAALIERLRPELRRSAESRRYGETVETISRFIEPVDRFFTEVLVIDPDNPAATFHRKELLSARLKPLLTSFFDIRELAGQAARTRRPQ